MKTDYLRRIVKTGSKLSWRLIREDDNEAFSRYRASAKATIRRYIHREQRRAQLAKLTGIIGGHKRKKEKDDENPGVCQPLGAMAPANTTQYLMRNAYEDMKTSSVQFDPTPNETSAHAYVESLSPSCVYAALDSGYETCLAFQHRDFEEVYQDFE